MVSSIDAKLGLGQSQQNKETFRPEHDRSYTYAEISAGCGKFVLGCMVGAVASQVHSGEATISGKFNSQY